MQSSGRTGWYFRVPEDGVVGPDDRLTLVDRRAPDWTIERIWRVFYVDTLNRDELAGLVDFPPLVKGWRRHASRRLRTSPLEDWSKRLDG